jgi:hypothetical protein
MISLEPSWIERDQEAYSTPSIPPSDQASTPQKPSINMAKQQ